MMIFQTVGTRPYFSAASIALAWLCIPHSSLAQSSGKASAEALFAAGRKLMGDGKTQEACPKFADSQRLDPASGTLINLGACYEKLGRNASAWAAYQEAAALAQTMGRSDNLQIAQKRSSAIVPRLSRIVVTVASNEANLEVLRDGIAVAASEWGIPIPLDKGEHHYEASAPGFLTWKGKIQITSDGADSTIAIPALTRAPVLLARKNAPSVQPGSPSTWRSMHTAAVASGAMGLASLGTATVFAILAKSSYSQSLDSCRTPPADVNRCTPPGVEERTRALSQGNLATTAFVIGSVAAATSVVLWIAAPSRRAPSVSQLSLSGSIGGAILSGKW
jgi:hypothetical protein